MFAMLVNLWVNTLGFLFKKKNLNKTGITLLVFSASHAREFERREQQPLNMIKTKLLKKAARLRGNSRILKGDCVCILLPSWRQTPAQAAGRVASRAVNPPP